jgi:hypothetical protein
LCVSFAPTKPSGCPSEAADKSFLLFYEVGEDYVSRRAEFRDAHLKKAWKASERGELLLGGALLNPVDGAVLAIQGRLARGRGEVCQS